MNWIKRDELLRCGGLSIPVSCANVLFVVIGLRFEGAGFHGLVRKGSWWSCKK